MRLAACIALVLILGACERESAPSDTIRDAADSIVGEVDSATPTPRLAEGAYAPRDECKDVPGAEDFRRSLAKAVKDRDANALAALARQGHGIDEEQTLTPAEQALEALLMGLRLTEGVELARVESAIDTVAVARLADQGLLAAENERLRATGKGRLLLDSILAEIALG